jgi:hypothetical protein
MDPPAKLSKERHFKIFTILFHIQKLNFDVMAGMSLSARGVRIRLIHLPLDISRGIIYFSASHAIKRIIDSDACAFDFETSARVIWSVFFVLFVSLCVRLALVSDSATTITHIAHHAWDPPRSENTNMFPT